MIDAELKLYSGTTEYGTEANPISFLISTAGAINGYALNPLYLWNDKGGLLGSVPAREIKIQAFEMWVKDELMGVSDGTPSQSFTTALSPIYENEETEEESIVFVGLDVWKEVDNLIGQAPDAEVYVVDATTGTITFGDGVNGAIPLFGLNIVITYMPELLIYGKEISENNWLEVKSQGVTSNSVAVVDELQTSIDATHVVLANVNIAGVAGVWLFSDPTHSGTNYYTGGSVDALNGIITLGTPLGDLNVGVLINYNYTIIDDGEADYSPIGENISYSHTFANPIPQNNAKLLYFRLNVPSTATPSGGSQVNFRLRLTYKQ